MFSYLSVLSCCQLSLNICECKELMGILKSKDTDKHVSQEVILQFLCDEFRRGLDIKELKPLLIDHTQDRI